MKGGKAAQQQAQALAVQQLAPLSRQQLLQLLGAKSDLALLAILASGNDYLPAVKGAAKLEQLWARWAGCGVLMILTPGGLPATTRLAVDAVVGLTLTAF
jgi:sarcosine oxidase gamma subunit